MREREEVKKRNRNGEYDEGGGGKAGGKEKKRGRDLAGRRGIRRCYARSRRGTGRWSSCCSRPARPSTSGT